MCLDNIILAHAFYIRSFRYGLIYVSGNAICSLLSDNSKTSAEIPSSLYNCVYILYSLALTSQTGTHFYKIC